ncbi:1-acyl-sn-glycerol-3-phosphate acyltransferase [Paenibacillus sp. ACRRX]|uniref:lysophospholipid acyltransferase family protein n=1 Tax=unclassified Paenibacillus TaxID=185978 RepID=UPI001EF6FFE1|nr:MULTISPECIES: lysophospholipid acyltransferase family protein [unclassified Paenibacillus]MCG7409624.1 1-acyl-sn-glycerol-3-phosphate acyltransferase [Paenibacillus sp. ACRRX]MDK8183300.1 lysophospholipid acyltransferase family protein [Paenibacillus sp. UMB4589-SE434]
MKFIRTLIWFIYFWLYLLFLIPSMLKANSLYRKGRFDELDAYTAKQVGRWARSLLRVAGAKVEVQGLEHMPKDGAVFIANHQGNFDVPIMLGHIGAPKALMAKVELTKLPFIRVWMKYLRCIFVDRKNVRQAMNSLNEAAELVKNGHSIVIFPEGTRSKGDHIGDFKNGGFRVATKTGALIVPIRINGSYKLMEANGNWIRPATVKVTILPPVPTAGLTKEETAALPEQIKELIVNAS